MRSRHSAPLLDNRRRDGVDSTLFPLKTDAKKWATFELFSRSLGGTLSDSLRYWSFDDNFLLKTVIKIRTRKHKSSTTGNACDRFDPVLPIAPSILQATFQVWSEGLFADATCRFLNTKVDNGAVLSLRVAVECGTHTFSVPCSLPNVTELQTWHKQPSHSQNPNCRISAD